MSFLRGTEEYYQKFIELQEKLRKSEEERLVLEMKFNEMVQITREEEQAYYRKLRNQYKRFLEEDRRRQERNERIMRVMERIESRASMLAAKTERFELLRQQYLAYLKRVSFNSNQNQEPLQQPHIPEDIPTIIEERCDLYDHPVIQKALYGDKLRDYNRGADLYEHPVIKKALFGDEGEKKSSPKLDVVNQYLRSLSTPISGEEVLKATRSSDKMSRPREFSDSNESNSYGDEHSFYKSNAGTIADKIINSINSKPKFSSPYRSKYDGKISGRDMSYKPTESTFCSTKTSPTQYKSGTNDDVEVFNYPNISADTTYLNIGKDERGDKERLKKGEVRFKDFDYKSNDESIDFSKAMQENEDYDVKDYLPKREYNTEEASVEEENVMVESLDSESVVEGDVDGVKEMYRIEQFAEPDNTEEYPYKTKEEVVNIVDNDNVSENIKDGDYIEQTLDEIQSLASETKQEIYISEIEEKQDVENEKDVYNETIENEEVTSKEEFSKYNTDYETNVAKDIQEDNEYYKHQQSLQNDELISNVQTDERDQNIIYDENQEYDTNNQPILHSNENDNLHLEYDGTIQKNIVENEPHAEIQPGAKYDNDPSNIQYNDEQEPIIHKEDKIDDSPAKFDNDQHEKSENIERCETEDKPLIEETNSDHQSNHQRQPIAQYDQNASSFGQYEHDQHIEYDKNGQPLMTYDQSQMQYNDNTRYNEAGEPVLQYDENGQPIMQYDEHGQPIMMQYDENGQPIVQYDQNGQPIMMQYDENGQPIMMQYDEQGQPIMQYDQNGQPIIMQYDQNGHPISQYDAHGQSIMYDENGQPMIQYDENGQPIYQYGQGEEYYQDNQLYSANVEQQQHYEQPNDRTEIIEDSREVTKNVDDEETVREQPATDASKKQITKHADSKEAAKDKPGTDGTKKQPTKNADSKETAKEKQATKNVESKEAVKEKPSADATKKQPAKNADPKEATKETPATDAGKKQTPAKSTEKKPNVIDMLDTDTESVKQDTRVSNDSDFDFSNS